MNTQEAPLAPGDKAPNFTLPTNEGDDIHLSALEGQIVVVYFYPKDNTPGCTTEALDFSSLKEEFAAHGAKVIGISPDSVKKHQNFVTKHDLSVLLAADTEKTTIEAYGSWVEKKMYGKTYMGVDRSTFLIAKDGTIAQIWRKVRVKNHAQDVLDAVKAL